jgi:NAD(P)-dependent dehydrogenase (short-subunit alcohol dehydrogenase family)
MSTATAASPMQREPELRGQTVVVIGGSAGIGLATARRARAKGARAAERAGVRQEECADIHRVGKRGLSVYGCSHSTDLSIDLGDRVGGESMTPVTYDREIAASRDCGGSSSRRLEGVLSASDRETHCSFGA